MEALALVILFNEVRKDGLVDGLELLHFGGMVEDGLAVDGGGE